MTGCVVTMDNVTLIHADAADALCELGEPVGLVLTDPPYGAGFAARPLRYQRAAGQEPQAWDNEPVPDALMGTVRTFGDAAIIWGGNYYPLPPTRGFLIWSKTGNAPSMADCEMAWTNIDMNARVFKKSVKSASLEKDLAAGAHPTQKPVELMRWSMMFHPEGTVLDPFAGSGTTGVAAIREGRRFIGIERDARFFDMMVERCRVALTQPRFSLPPPAVPAVQHGMTL